MKLGKPFKSMTKGLVGTVSNLAKGDISGAANSWTNFATFGTLGLTSGGAVANLMESPEKVSGDTSGLANEAANTAKKRKSMYFTEGEELGQETTRVFNTQKRGSIFS